MVWMLPQTGSPTLHLMCASDTVPMCIGSKLTTRNQQCLLRIREASYCETNTVLTVTAVPGYAGKVNVPAVKAHSTSLTTIDNVQFNTQSIGHHTKSSMEATMATETLLQSEMARISAAAAEAVALAKAAVMAAKDVVALSESQTLSTSEYLMDFPSETDLLRLERARLTETKRLRNMESLYHVKSENDFQEKFEFQSLTSSNSSDTLKRDRNLLEQQTRKKRASDKAANDPARVVSAKPAQKGKRSASRKGKMSAASWHHIPNSLSLTRKSKRSKLLTSKEEVELSQGIQELLKLDQIRKLYKENIGREPTLAQWAKAVGVDQKTFRRRLRLCRDSRDKMISSNIRLVISVAKNYQNQGLSLEDLIYEGTTGLMRGAEKFDGTLGFKFSTYAYWWIRQAITKALTLKSRTIRFPCHVYELLTRIRKAKRLLQEENERQPTNAELAEVVGTSIGRTVAVIKAARSPRSLDKCVGPERDLKLSAIFSDSNVESSEDIACEKLMKRDLHKFLETLNAKEKEVIGLRYGLCNGKIRSLQEIGAHFSVSRERARQIETEAMRKLKKSNRKKQLRHYVETHIQE